MSQESGEFHSSPTDGEKQTVPEQPVHRDRAIDRAKELLKRLFTRRGGRNRGQEPQPRESPSQEEPIVTQIEEPEPEPEPLSPSGNFNRQNAREMERLVEQGTSDLRVLPGEEWAMHYPNGMNARTQAIEQLFAGAADPYAEVTNVTPDALFYDQKELIGSGFSTVRNRVVDVVTSHDNYDYGKFTNFLAEMHGTQMDVELAQKLYNTVAYDRIRHVMLDTYHGTDRTRIIETIRNDIRTTPTQMRSLDGMEQIFAALKTNTYADIFDFVSPVTQHAVASNLSARNEAIVTDLQDSYNDYMESGDEAAYDTLVRAIKAYYQQEPEEEPPPEPPKPDAKLPPHTDEYQPPTESDSDSMRFFEVTPSGDSTEPPVDNYVTAKQGYFDRAGLAWKSTNAPRAYTTVLAGTERYTITNIPEIEDDQLYEIPIPDGFALDYNSLHVTGSDARLLQDQNGYFFIQGSDVGKFTVDFLPSDKTVSNPPQTVDRTNIHTGSLEGETEAFIQELTGAGLTPQERVQKVDEFIKARHVYPSGEELMTLQQELFDRSTGDTYIQNLEQSELLDCYLGNTLAIAMLRYADVPSRLVKGHAIDDREENKVVIDSTTGHAWSEFWDGNQWVVYDFTPDKPSAAAQEEETEKNGEEGEEGDGEKGEGEQPAEGDGGEGSQAEVPEGMPQPLSGRDNDMQLVPQVGVGDQAVQQGELDMEAAAEAIQEATVRERQLQQQLENVDSFEAAQGMREEVEGDEQLFNDMKDKLEDVLSARERLMKEGMLEELEQMSEEGFLSEDQEETLREQIGQADAQSLDQIREQIVTENSAYTEFQHIREEIEPLVDHWFEYFVSKLPREDVVTYDDTVLGKRGRLDAKALGNLGKYLTGKVLSPRVMRPEIKAKFIASVVVDVSSSMVLNEYGASDPRKLNDAKRLLIFYNELFSRISEQYGYIKYANYAFAENIRAVKRFEQQYNSSKRYGYDGDESATVKARLMQVMQPSGGTDMLKAVQTAAEDLNAMKEQYGDYISALYYVGDGGDSFGQEALVREFLRLNAEEGGLGEHQVHATMLGDDHLRSVLANVFGETNTAVAPNMETLIAKSMEHFEDDMEEFLRGKVT